MPIRFALILAGLLTALGASAQGRPDALPLPLEARAWSPYSADPGSQQVQVLPGGPATVAITGKLPGAFGASCRLWQDWLGYGRLSFAVKVPAGFPADADLQVYLKDFHYYWYQAYPLHTAKAGKNLPYTPGQWQTFTISLRPGSRDWQPAGHQQSWYDAPFRPQEFGVRFFSAKPWSGTVQIGAVSVEGFQPPLANTPQPGGALLPPKPVANATTVPQYEKFELTWPVDQLYSNPYDPAVVAVEGHFLSPGGQMQVIPGFFYQGYTRTKSSEGFERLTPVGGPQWKVRFAPRETGAYRYYVQVTDARGTRRSPEVSFTAAAPLHPQGIARVSKTDPHYFEWENGQYLVPMPINMRDGGDQAEAQPGSYDFDHFFPLFRASGLNTVRTWMCAWWAGIEWSQKYHSRFSDLGRYAQYNAWRLDYTMDLAAQNDLLLELTLGSHGQLRQDKFDAEWQYSPYAVENGGFLPAPYMFFTSERAKADVKQRYRYIAARWGYSRNVFSWDLWNEIDLSEGYNPAEVAAWNQEMATFLRSVDQQPHLITTHIALYWSAGPEMWRLPEIDYIQSDSYWKRRDDGMNESFASRVEYNKPFLFIEYGPQTSELPQPESRWLQEYRVGMWVSALLPWSGPGAFWYQKEWEQYRLGDFQKGLQAYLAGEDRRGKGLHLARVTLNAAGTLRVQAMQNETSAYFYVYDYDRLGLREQPPGAPPGPTALLSGLRPGNYRVEFWDPEAGRITATVPMASADGTLSIPLPPIAPDLAVKVLPAG
jgi:hypothetical protein